MFDATRAEGVKGGEGIQMKVVQMEVIVVDNRGAADCDVVETVISRDIQKALKHAYNEYLKTMSPSDEIQLKAQIRIFDVESVG